MVQQAEKGKKKVTKQQAAVDAKKKKKKRKSETTVTEGDAVAKKSRKSEKNNKKNDAESNNEHITAETDSKKESSSLKKKKKKGKKANKKKLTDKSKDKSNKDEIESVHSTENTAMDETEDIVWTNSGVDSCKNSTSSSYKERSDTETIFKPKDIRVDPKKIFRIEDQGDDAENGESDSLQQKRIDIQQAFANDDVVEEFVQEKSEFEEASKPKDVDLTLPGWGSWAGVGIKPSEKKKKQFTKKANPAPPRKDKDLSHVIINEEKSKFFIRNQV